MLIPNRVVERLSEIGVVVVARPAAAGGSARIGVRLEVPIEGGRSQVLNLEVKRFSRPVSAVRLTELAARHRRGGLLVICPSVSPAARRRAEELGISLIALNQGRSSGPDGHLAVGPGHVVPVRDPESAEPAVVRARPSRQAWGSLQVLRALAADAAGTQAQIASRSGVSQPRVSQVLKKLSQQGVVRSEPDSTWSGPARRAWVVQSWGDFLDYWLANYPGPGGIRTNWYGLDPPRQQARVVTALLARQGRERLAPPRDALLVADPDAGPSVLVSGDVAADEYAPWAAPQQVVIYSRHGADLGPARLTPSSAEQATTVLVVPEDPGVWVHMTRSWPNFREVVNGSEVPLADPLQVLFDVAHSPSTDADQAVDHLRRYVAQGLSGERRPA